MEFQTHLLTFDNINGNKAEDLTPAVPAEQNGQSKMNTISLEQLAQELNGKLWVKGDMKRIYLDRGHNTKKMTTKTYVYQKEDGSFGVNCYIDCPSQHYNWIQAQQQEIIESVETAIQQAIALQNVELVEYKINEEKAEADVLIKADAEAEAQWFTEEKFYNEFGQYPADFFGGKLEADLEVALDKKREANRAERKEKITAKAEDQADDEMLFQIGQTVKHGAFGLGKVISAGAGKVEVTFNNAEVGTKNFLAKFVKLEIVNG